MLRMINAQSKSTLPAGDVSLSAKKLEYTSSTSNGWTCQLNVFRTKPSSRLPAVVAEYPSEPASKKRDASSTVGNDEVAGNAGAALPTTRTITAPSDDRILKSI